MSNVENQTRNEIIWRKRVIIVAGHHPGGLSFQQRLVFEGELQQLVMAVQLQFVADFGAMILYGPVADEQLSGDFTAGSIFRYQLEYAFFHRCQQVEPWFFIIQLFL